MKSDIWYMIYDIWYMIYDIWYIIYDLWYTIYVIWYSDNGASFVCEPMKMLYDIVTMGPVLLCLGANKYDVWYIV